MHSRIYAFQQTGRGVIIPKVEVEKNSYRYRFKLYQCSRLCCRNRYR